MPTADKRIVEMCLIEKPPAPEPSTAHNPAPGASLCPSAPPSRPGPTLFLLRKLDYLGRPAPRSSAASVPNPPHPRLCRRQPETGSGRAGRPARDRKRKRGAVSWEEPRVARREASLFFTASRRIWPGGRGRARQEEHLSSSDVCSNQPQSPSVLTDPWVSVGLGTLEWPGQKVLAWNFLEAAGSCQLGYVIGRLDWCPRFAPMAGRSDLAVGRKLHLLST
ncbi:uncharacterized protein LOC123637231 [Lemur catta]|uniref:uncharacterized protein LOC123637231 n=1 Tax=Lemur catta TaxID=9447 RepID=UPI001E26B5E4|nr:uncharacterized protein LOC123637231 [Lemur catta]